MLHPVVVLLALVLRSLGGAVPPTRSRRGAEAHPSQPQYWVKQAPTCLHFDIEPHFAIYDPEWDNLPSRPAHLNNFIEALYDIKARFQSHVMSEPSISACLNADIPNWFDGESKRFVRSGAHAGADAGLSVLPSDQVIKIMDRITIMDYINTTQKMIDRATDEIGAVASRNAGQKVILGMEVSCNSQPLVSWCTYTDERMEQVLTDVHTHFSSGPNRAFFEGMAIHWVEPYVERASVPQHEVFPRAVWAWNLIYRAYDSPGTLEVDWLDYLKAHKVNTIYLCVNDFWEDEVALLLNLTYPWATVELLFGDNNRWIYEGRNEINALMDQTGTFLKKLIIVEDPNKKGANSSTTPPSSVSDGTDATIIAVAVSTSVVSLGVVVVVVVVVVILVCLLCVIPGRKRKQQELEAIDDEVRTGTALRDVQGKEQASRSRGPPLPPLPALPSRGSGAGGAGAAFRGRDVGD